MAFFRTLADHADCVVDKGQLFERVWAGRAVTDDSLVQCVADIRRALGERGHDTLRTIPGRGYLLVSDTVPTAPDSQASLTANATTRTPAESGSVKKARQTRSGSRRRHLTIGLCLLLAFIVVIWRLPAPEEGSAVAALPAEPRVVVTDDTVTRDTLPSIAVSTGLERGDGTGLANVFRETRIALGRYRSVALQDAADAEADFLVRLSPGRPGDGPAGITVEIVDTVDGRVLATEVMRAPAGEGDTQASTMDDADVAGQARALGIRVAACIASPGGGVIVRNLLETSRSKPVEALTRAECYAYGYGCTTCSGELESITPRAEACLADRFMRRSD